MLKLQRRHTPKCSFYGKDIEGGALNQLKCKAQCPFRISGTDENGRRVRETLKTRDYERAMRRYVELRDQGADKPKGKAIAVAIIDYLGRAKVQEGTLTNYTRTLNLFAAFAAREHLAELASVTASHIESFLASRSLGNLTFGKELAVLRTFFSFCGKNGWMVGNPAGLVKAPPCEPKEVEPFTAEEFRAMVQASETFGRRDYERRRAKAMLVLLRCTALRISDIAVMRRDRIQPDGQIRVRTIKRGKWVCLPLPEYALYAIQALPKPLGGPEDGEYLFWSGNGKRKSMVRDATRTMHRVFLKSGVDGAYSHRFRHTLANELFDRGASHLVISQVLGNSPRIVEKHYVQKLSVKRQDEINSLMQTVHAGTDLAQTKMEPAKC